MVNFNYADYLLSKYQDEGSLYLNNYNHVRQGKLASVGSSISFQIRIPNKFFWKDFKIMAYDVAGSVYGISQNLRDVLTVQILNNSTGQNLFEAPVDITLFSPHNIGVPNIFPEVLEPNTNLTITIYHEPVVGIATYNDLLTLPIDVRVYMIGAVMNKVNNGF